MRNRDYDWLSQSLCHTQCMKTMAERLEGERERLGETQKEFAKRIGVPQSSYNEYINTSKKMPAVAFMRICEALQWTPEYLFYGSGPASVADRDGSEHQAMLTFRRLSAASQQTALGMMKLLLDPDQGNADGVAKEPTPRVPPDDLSLVTPPNSATADPADQGSIKGDKNKRHGKSNPIQLQEHVSRTRKNQPKA